MGVACAVFALYYVTAAPETVHFEHLIQALAWTQHHTYIDNYAALVWEKVQWRGHWYQLHPPLSAAVMWLALQLHEPHATLVSVVVGTLGAALVYRLTQSFWLLIFFAFGTDYWYEATLGDPWGFCLVLSCLPTLLALRLCLTEPVERMYLDTATGLYHLVKPNPALRVGIYAGLAALARYDLVMAWPVYLLLLRRPRLPALYGMAAALAFYVVYAYVRFGTYTDISLWLWWRQDAPAVGLDPALGPFSLHYLPLGLYTALYLGPVLTPGFPWFAPQPIGQALLTTSPGLLIALRAPWRERATQLLSLAVIARMSGALCVYSNGISQFGARYWIQALPFFVALMNRRPLDQMAKALIVLSVGANAFGVWHIRVLGWG